MTTDRQEPTSGAPGMLLIQVTVGRFGASKKGDVSKVETDADKALLKLSKRLLDCPEYDAIVKLDHAVNAHVRMRSVPSNFRAGIYHILPTTAEELDNYLTACANERIRLVDRLGEVYEAQRLQDRERLGSQYQDTDYPSVDAMADRYRLEWRFFTMGAPGDLAAVSPELFAREKARIVDLLEEARTEAVGMLRAGFAELVDHLVDKLTPTKAGKRKRFFATNLSNLTEFLETFKSRDVGSDEELADLIGKARQIMAGVDVEKIRDESGFADQLRDSFEKVRQQAGALVSEAPGRRINPADFGA